MCPGRVGGCASLVLAFAAFLSQPCRAQSLDAPHNPEQALEQPAGKLLAPISPLLQPVMQTPRRPPLLAPLYASHIGLQALDIHSTRRALSNGNTREANPVVRAAVNNMPVVIAMKAAGTLGVIVAGEKLWKRHRTAAVVLVAVLDGALTGVVAHNYRIPRQ